MLRALLITNVQLLHATNMTKLTGKILRTLIREEWAKLRTEASDQSIDLELFIAIYEEAIKRLQSNPSAKKVLDTIDTKYKDKGAYPTKLIVQFLEKYDLGDILDKWGLNESATSFDDGTKDSRGLVKALQDYVNNNLEGPANVLVDMSDNWDGQPAYVISQAGGSGAAYKLTGEPHTDMRSQVVSSPGQLDTKRIIDVTPEKLKAWLSGTDTQPLAPNLPPAPTPNQIKR